MKKKIVSIIMASAMVFGLAACGSGDSGSTSSGSSDTAGGTAAKSESSDVVEGGSADDNT